LSTFSILFFTRPGCHICDDARPIVSRVARRMGMPIEEVNIDGDDDLVALYGMRIPVVALGDLVVAEGIIDDEKSLRRALRAAAR